MPEEPTTSDFSACPHWGKGGRFVVDAEGKRVPVVKPAASPAASESAGTPAEAPAAGAAQQPAKKGK